MNKAAFWDAIAERYSKQPIKNPNAYQYKLNTAKGYFQSTDTILEIGCGTGQTAIWHSHNVSKVHAIDASEKMVAIANERLLANQIDNVAFEHCDLSNFSWGSSYNHVLALNILHLVEEQERSNLYSKIYQQLEPNGKLIVSTPCLAEKDSLIIAILSKFLPRLGKMPEVEVFSLAEHIAEITNTGFLLEKLWPQGDRRNFFMVFTKAK